MIVLPAGDFLMGSPEDEGSDHERPQHHVTIAKPFAMGPYLVTTDEYARFLADIRRKATNTRELALHGQSTRLDPDRSGYPVGNVTCKDAAAYCEWLSEKTGKYYRLPSEAEWEYAARGGTTTRYYWGDTPGRNHANFHHSFLYRLFHPRRYWIGERPSPVGCFDPNPFGLYDMLGNISEWVEDCWHEGYAGAPTDGSAWLEDCICEPRPKLLSPFDVTRVEGVPLEAQVLGVARGGPWSAESHRCRAAYRSHFVTKDVGFRVVRPLSEEH